MMRLTVEERDGFIILVFDDNNTPTIFHEVIPQYIRTLEHHAKVSKNVLFKIDERDADSLWMAYAIEWIKQRGNIHFVCADESTKDVILISFDLSEKTIHSTVEEAINALR